MKKFRKNRGLALWPQARDPKRGGCFFLSAAGIFLILLSVAALFWLPTPVTWESSPSIQAVFSQGAAEIPLEDFLAGVLAAEMPAAFPLEALKAQAVAARTYVYIHSPLNPKGDGSRHEEGAVCCQAAHCQAWLSQGERQERWGQKAAEYEKKIRQAVAETRGLILTYEGEAAEAPYFSTCGGRTESAQELWGSHRPWLISVACNWGAEAPHYRSEEVFSLEEAGALLDCLPQEVAAMKELGRTSGGRVDALEVGGKTLSGSEVRGLLGLRAAAFTWQVAKEEISFAVSGYGHGVGLCQYGAGGMSRAGYGFEEILKHYYTGVEVERIY